MLLQCKPLQRLFLPTLLLVAFALHLQLLDRFPLREDEALYSYWARSLRHEDFLMRTVWPDKPPLFLWTQAAVFEFLGPSQASARLLNLGLATLTVAVVATTGRRLWGMPAGNLSALLLALNPFAISFAATAYTDPLLVFCGQLALYLALCGRAIGAGIWLAAAIMTKQQGLLYLPLVLMALLWVTPPYPSPLRNRRQDPQAASPLDTPAPTELTGMRQIARRKVAYAAQWLMGLCLLLLPILYWDSLRWRVAPSPWDLSIRNYAPLAWVPPSQWWERMQSWGDLIWYFGGDHWVWVGYSILILCSVRVGRWTRPARAVVLLLGWCGGYLLLHVVTTIQIWDRYLLPLVPMMALLVTAFVTQSFPTFRDSGGSPPKPTSVEQTGVDRKRYTGWTCGITIAVTVLLLPTALNAARGTVPIGGDRGAYSGLVEATQWIRTQNVPFVLYHQRLGWHYHFYLFDEWQNEQADLRWFPNAVYLADNAAKLPYRRRFYVQPTWHPIPNLYFYVTTRNMRLVERAHFGEMTLYEIINRPQPPCSWCRCAPPATVLWPHVTTPGERLLSSPVTEP